MNERCECCDSENVYTSHEKIGGYVELILVTHCDDCGLSYYQEPVKRK